MLKSIKSFFQSITSEQLERKALSDMQVVRLRKEYHLNVVNTLEVINDDSSYCMITNDLLPISYCSITDDLQPISYCSITNDLLPITTITPSDLDYYNQLMSTSSESSEKVNVLKNLIPFVLDNSIRESTVGQLRGHTVEDKNAILTALKGTPAVEGAPEKTTGIKHIVVATFNDLESVEQVWLKELKENDPTTFEKFFIYAFSELHGATIDKFEEEPVGLKKSRECEVPNLIFEFDILPEKLFKNPAASKEMVAEMMTTKIKAVQTFSPSAKIFFNYRDALIAFNDAVGRERMIYYTKYLAQLPLDLRPFGIIFEEPTGTNLPWTYTILCKVLRKTMDDNGWTGAHLLVHVHNNYGLTEACVLECLASGCDGVWGGLSEEGAATGANSTLITLTNLARIGNENVKSMFNFVELLKATKVVSEVSTNKPPHDRQELYGPRAFDTLWEGGMGDETFRELGCFHTTMRIIRMTTVTSASSFKDHLEATFDIKATEWKVLKEGETKDPTFKYIADVVVEMKRVMFEDLNEGRSLDYQFSPGLFDLYQRAGGTEFLEKMEEKVNSDSTIESDHRLILELKNYFDAFDYLSDGEVCSKMDYNTFFNSFLGRYICSPSSALARDMLEALDIDESNMIEWDELLVNAKWALYEYPNESLNWTVDDLIRVIVTERLIPFTIQQKGIYLRHKHEGNALPQTTIYQHHDCHDVLDRCVH